MDQEYYAKQLKKLNIVSEVITIKLYDYEGNKTNDMTLNSDSIAELIDFFAERLKQLTYKE